jgi:hypothetical protein
MQRPMRFGVWLDAGSTNASLTNNLAGTTNDQTLGFGYNSASQVLTRTASNTSA